MTNMQGKGFHKNQTETIQFAMQQTIKKRLKSMTPGIVVSYDATKRRASVMPALKKTYTDDTPSSDPPVVYDVPVVFNCTGGYEMVQPLKEGDTVVLDYSHRGLDNFKGEGNPSFGLVEPDDAEPFSLKDVVAYPFGFSNAEHPDDALVIRRIDGERSVLVGDDSIEMNFGSGDDNRKVFMDEDCVEMSFGTTFRLGIDSNGPYAINTSGTSRFGLSP